LLGDAGLVDAVLNDVESCPFDDRHKALFRFIDAVNHDSPNITSADLDTVRAAGWTDEELYFAITVCALFNFYNRWIDATGVHALSDEAHRQGGKRSAVHGYVRK
jgi:alkylhydroperoxidase family enzyme